MFKAVGFLVRFDPIQSQQIRQEALEKKMAAQNPFGNLFARGGQMDFLAA